MPNSPGSWVCEQCRQTNSPAIHAPTCGRCGRPTHPLYRKGLKEGAKEAALRMARDIGLETHVAVQNILKQYD